MPKISFRNVKKVYPNGTYALNGVSFDINKGDFVCIIGESGGGKTTLLRLIAGLEKATCGEIYFNDEISNYLEIAKRDVAFVFQEYALYPNKTVFENIISSLSKSKMSYEEKYTKTIDIIEKMNLDIISGEVPKHLSFGQCQKVALARALVRKPKIMLFDEPLSNIDVEAKDDYKKLIIEAKKILPQSIFIYVTHNINDTLQLSDKIMVIDKGDIIQFDDRRIVYEYPLNKRVCDYILEYKDIIIGKIEKNKFISENNECSLLPINLLEADDRIYENVTCYSNGKRNYYFDSKGNSVSIVKDEYQLDITINDSDFTILNKKVEFKDLHQVLLKKGHFKALLKRDLFSFNKIKNTFEIEGAVIYTSKDLFIIRVENTNMAFFSERSFIVGDKVKLYYPIEGIRVIDENGNHIISNYIISNNELNFKIIDSKKGIIRLGKRKIQNKVFINMDYSMSIRVPLNAFNFNESGMFVCDYLFNEELLGSKTLIHFRTNGISEYLSSLVDYSFKGYAKKIIKYDIDFTKVKIVKVAGGKKNEKK